MSRTENDAITASPSSDRYQASFSAEKPNAAPAIVRLQPLAVADELERRATTA